MKHIKHLRIPPCNCFKCPVVVVVVEDLKNIFEEMPTKEVAVIGFPSQAGRKYIPDLCSQIRQCRNIVG